MELLVSKILQSVEQPLWLITTTKISVPSGKPEYYIFRNPSKIHELLDQMMRNMFEKDISYWDQESASVTVRSRASNSVGIMLSLKKCEDDDKWGHYHYHQSQWNKIKNGLIDHDWTIYLVGGGIEVKVKSERINCDHF